MIVLTTHSMEEADALGDKVAIMSAGQLDLGSTLKNKYGGGFVSLLASKVDMSDKIKKFVLESIASQFVSETQGNAFRLENSNEKSCLLISLLNWKHEGKIGNWTFLLATLHSMMFSLILPCRKKMMTKKNRG